MSEVNSPTTRTRLLIGSLKWKHFDETTRRQFYEVVEASEALSSLIPEVSESNIFEIDDLLYSRRELPANYPSKIRPTESIQSIIDENLKIFHSILSRRDYYFHPVVWMAYLQLLEHSTDKAFHKEMETCYRFIYDLLKSRNLHKISNALKMLRILFYKNSKKFKKCFEYFEGNEILEMMFVFKLKNMPQAQCPNIKRITTWISQQSTIITDSLKLIPNVRYHYKNSLKLRAYLKKGNLKDYMRQLIKCGFFMRMWDDDDLRKGVLMEYPESIFVVDHIYEFFMSAQNEEEQLKCMKYFRGAFLEDFNDQPIPCHLILLQQPLLLSRIFGEIIGGLVIDLLWKCDETDSLDSSFTDLEKIARSNGFNMETYLSGNHHDSIDYEEINWVNMNEKASDPEGNEEEEDYTIEKFLVFDEFVKRIQLVNILYTTILKLDILEKGSEEDHEIYFFSIFRDNDKSRFYRDLFRKTLFDSSKRYELPWFLKLVMQKCPFVFLSKYHVHLMKDLLRVLKGEEIHEDIREELSLALCHGKSNTKFIYDDDFWQELND